MVVPMYLVLLSECIVLSDTFIVVVLSVAILSQSYTFKYNQARALSSWNWSGWYCFVHFCSPLFLCKSIKRKLMSTFVCMSMTINRCWIWQFPFFFLSLNVLHFYLIPCLHYCIGWVLFLLLLYLWLIVTLSSCNLNKCTWIGSISTSFHAVVVVMILIISVSYVLYLFHFMIECVYCMFSYFPHTCQLSSYLPITCPTCLNHFQTTQYV